MDETNIFIFYEGEKVHLTPSDLRNQSLFKQAVMNQTNKVPPTITAQEFKDMSTDLFDVVVNVEPTVVAAVLVTAFKRLRPVPTPDPAIISLVISFGAPPVVTVSSVTPSI